VSDVKRERVQELRCIERESRNHETFFCSDFDGEGDYQWKSEESEMGCTEKQDQRDRKEQNQ
jgi:hypothetical protein